MIDESLIPQKSFQKYSLEFGNPTNAKAAFIQRKRVQ